MSSALCLTKSSQELYLSSVYLYMYMIIKCVLLIKGAEQTIYIQSMLILVLIAMLTNLLSSSFIIV